MSDDNVRPLGRDTNQDESEAIREYTKALKDGTPLGVKIATFSIGLALTVFCLTVLGGATLLALKFFMDRL